jgi:hypothetical protein
MENRELNEKVAFGRAKVSNFCGGAVRPIDPWNGSDNEGVVVSSPHEEESNFKTVLI